MGFLDYFIPIVSGIAFLGFLVFFIWLIHKAVLKPIGFYKIIKDIKLGFRKKKILADDKVVAYCVERVERGLSEAQVREELLLSNKYNKNKIDEMIFAFGTIKLEMLGDPRKKKVAQDLP